MARTIKFTTSAVRKVGERLAKATILTDVNDLFDTNHQLEYLAAKLAQFEATIGYPSGLTTAVISNHMRDGMVALALITYQRKLENASAAKEAFGANISQAFLNTPRYTGNIVTALTSPASYKLLNPVGESNAVWARRLGSMNLLIRVPAKMALIITYLYSNYFSNFGDSDEGHTEFIDLLPVDVNSGATDSIRVRLDAVISTLSGRVNTYPLLSTFMDYIGWTTQAFQSMDFTRDLQGNTYSIIQDTALIDSITSEKRFLSPMENVAGLSYSEDSVIALSGVSYGEVGIYQDFAHYQQIMDVTEDVLVNNFILGSKFRYSPYLISEVGGESIMLPPGKYSGAQINTHLSATSIQEAISRFVFRVWHRVDYTLNAVTPSHSANFVLFLRSGFNTYLYNQDDFDLVRDDFNAELRFGPSWRLGLRVPVKGSQ